MKIALFYCSQPQLIFMPLESHRQISYDKLQFPLREASKPYLILVVNLVPVLFESLKYFLSVLNSQLLHLPSFNALLYIPVCKYIHTYMHQYPSKSTGQNL